MANELLPFEKGYEYGNVLPFRIPVNQDGKQAGKAEWNPLYSGLVRGTVNSVADLISTPGRAYRGELSGEELQAAGPRMAVEALGLGMGLPKPTGSAGIFGGVLARTADKAKLAVAEHLEGLGTKPEEIWKATGWFRGADGKWRFEIPDTEAKLKGPLAPSKDAQGKDRSRLGWNRHFLDEVLDHPELFKAYPALRNRVVEGIPEEEARATGVRGAFDPGMQRISISPGGPRAVRSTVMHETQHAVQLKEGHAGGASYTDFLPSSFDSRMHYIRDSVDKIAEKLRGVGADYDDVVDSLELMQKGKPLTPKLQESLDKLGPAKDEILDSLNLTFKDIRMVEQMRNDALGEYKKVAGEVEARNVQKRLTSPLARSQFPHHTGDFPPHEQHVRFHQVEHDPFAVPKTKKPTAVKMLGTGEQ